LPVKNLNNLIAFFTQLGYSFNQQFTDETGTCRIVTADIFVMFINRKKSGRFTPKKICDAPQYTGVLLCLTSESRGLWSETVRKAVAAGGITYNDAQDHSFMEVRRFRRTYLKTRLYGVSGGGATQRQ
jgi:predicted lactoylglutathione lyase